MPPFTSSQFSAHAPPLLLFPHSPRAAMTESTSPVTEKLKSAVSEAQDLASAQLSSLRASSGATVTATERAIWTEQQAAAHAVSLHTFVEVDSELTERDRRDLASGLRHVNTGSLMSGSVMGLYMFSATLRRGLFAFRLVRFLGKSACGLTGFYLGTQVGMQIGTDVVSYRFGSSRPACHDAVTLVRKRPHISKWKRYYEGDRDLMVDLVYPPPLDDLAVDRSSAGILLDRRRSPVSRPSVSATAAAESFVSNTDMVSTAERDSHDAKIASGIAEYYSRLSKRRESNQARTRDLKSLYTSSLASLSSLESESKSAGASLVQQLLAVSDKISARFLNSYAVYLSNDYRRPFW
ncbi:hypothetical protein BZA70DRAFT_271680 [Myxozyma melibiosi]|uniref:MICOS complex subunit n=1 Tax=Myxozyma melibiosi TaxID=54550 RepID=A0ABR1FCU7_9ASCO